MRLIQIYGFYVGFRVVAFLVAWLPVRLTWPAFESLAKRASKRKNHQTEVVRQNLSHVVELPQKEMDSLVTKAFVSYALYWHELFRLKRVKLSDIADRVEVVGENYLDEVEKVGKGMILAMPHVGNWELSAGWSTVRGMPITVVAEELKPRALFDWFTRTRSRMGVTVLPLSPHVSSELLSLLEANKLVGLVCDRDIADSGVKVEFFGQETKLPAGPALLAARSGAGIIPTAVYFLEDRRLRIEFNSPIFVEKGESLRKAVMQGTQEVAQALQKLIAKHPDQWHMFQPVWPDHCN